MPSTEINSPVSSAPIDRLALGVDWVRPGAGRIGNSIDPSSAENDYRRGCFEGNAE